ncbi:MAG: RNA-binding S4 domain-containing protein [Lachnospiraceae bacterium]|jgi:ribosome-associated protein|nr:RNA-binding S4 domain-containing protein [Lachnospiraceae bacterium]
MEEVRIKDEFIKLGQALKLSGEAGSGIDAKFVIQDGKVTVNNEVELRRGRKLYKDDIFSYNGKEFIIKNS